MPTNDGNEETFNKRKSEKRSRKYGKLLINRPANSNEHYRSTPIEAGFMAVAE